MPKAKLTEEERREARRASTAKYRASPEGKAANKKYRHRRTHKASTMRRAAALLQPEELTAVERGRLEEQAKERITRPPPHPCARGARFVHRRPRAPKPADGSTHTAPRLVVQGVININGDMGEAYGNMADLHIEYADSGKPLDLPGLKRLVTGDVISYFFLGVHVGASAWAASAFQEDTGIRLLAGAGARLLNCIHSGDGSAQPWLSREPRATAVTVVNVQKLHAAGFRITRKQRVIAGGGRKMWGSEDLVRAR